MRGQGKYLINVVKKAIDLKGFVEREGAATLAPSGRDSWSGLCPLHKDGNPSFTVRRNSDGVWLFHCFGCNAGGTVIDFCMELKGFSNPHEAALYAANSEGIKFDETLIARARRDSKVTSDEQRSTDLAHFVVCENCRRLLRGCGGDEGTMSWVASAYKAMDKMLDDPSTTGASFEPLMAESRRRLAELARWRR